MTISATRSRPYSSVTVKIDEGQFNSGLLNQTERKAMAIELLDAAANLLMCDEDETYSKIVDIINDL